MSDIIVTAQKREERASETPLSLSVLSGEALQASGATQLADFAATVPGLSFTSNGVGQGQVNLRGVTTGLNVGSTVGIYVDEVPNGSSTSFAGAAQLALDVGLFDLERVEVLRGPQGTLYGASTMGGLLKYVTKVPDPTGFDGGLRAGVSATAHGGVGYDLAGAVNAPFAGDTAAVRLNGFYTQDGGFVDNRLSGADDVNQSEVYGGRVDVAFNPTEALSIRLTGFAQEIERDGSGSVDFVGATGRPVDGEYEQRRFAEPFAQSFRLASAVVDYDFGPTQLTSVTSYQTRDVDYVTDVSALYVPLLGGFGLAMGSTPLVKEVDTDKFTQEARLAGSVGAFEWIVGGFYTREKSFQLQTLPATDPTGAPFALNLLTAELPSLYEETAAFGTLTWQVTDRLDLSGGLRHAKNEQTYEQNASGLDACVPNLGPPPEDVQGTNITGLYYDPATGSTLQLLEHGGRQLIGMGGATLPARRDAAGRLHSVYRTFDAVIDAPVGDPAPAQLTYSQWGTPDVLARLEPGPQPDMTDRAGLYVSASTGTDAVLAVEGDQPTLTFKGRWNTARYGLTYAGASLWRATSIDMAHFGLGGFVEFDADGGGFAFSAGRTRRLRFERSQA